MEVKLDEFRKAFDWVDMVDKNPALPTSRYVRMVGAGEELELYLSGITIAMARCQASGARFEWYASRPHLGSFLGAAGGEEVTVCCNGNVLQLSCGSYSMELQQAHETLNYYDWDGAGDILQLPSVVASSMAMLSRYAARSPGLEHLSAVQLTSGFGAFASGGVALVGVCSQAVDTHLHHPRRTGGADRQTEDCGRSLQPGRVRKWLRTTAIYSSRGTFDWTSCQQMEWRIC
jgi:hypothetical protein